MYWFWLSALIYLAVGLVFVLRSGQRGFVEDLLFALLWPAYLLRYFHKGY